MKKFFVLSLMASLLFICFSFDQKGKTSFTNSAFEDSLEADRAKYIAIVNEHIKGKEKMRVDSVFSNLKVLGGFPAENLPRAMGSWSRALGVSCGYCHNTDNFSLDEKDKKDIAREMVNLQTIIRQKLESIKGLSERPVVNCTTCHRGDLKPAFRMPAK